MKGKKTGGRPKGTPNKRSQALEERAQALGVNPFEILLLFAKGDWEALGYPSEFDTKYTSSGSPYSVRIISPDTRQRSAAEVCQYLHPKRKAIEHSGGVAIKPFILENLDGKQTIMGMIEGDETE